MKTPFFLAPARAAALVLLPLAVLSLAPQSARAVSSPSTFVPKSPTFNSGNVLGSPFTLTLNGAASGVGSASLGIIGLVAGAKSYGTQAFLVNGGSAGSTGLLDPVSVLNGTTTIGSINIGSAGTVIPFSADFTIPDAVNLTLNSWTLTFNFGTSSATIGGLFYNGAAAETGTLTVATTVANPTYSADLQINATQIGSGTGSFTLVIPQNSINFDGSVVDLVPEPSTWALLGVGAGVLGFVTLRRRHSRAG